MKCPKPKAEILCQFLMREAKELKKFDYLLSSELLDIQYASMFLDVDGAWTKLLEFENLELRNKN